jgi:hypothetical protein
VNPKTTTIVVLGVAVIALLYFWPAYKTYTTTVDVNVLSPTFGEQIPVT